MKNQVYKLTSSQLEYAETMMGRPLTDVERFILAKAVNEAQIIDPVEFTLNFQHANDFYSTKYFPIEPFLNAIVQINTPITEV